jgi:hypothetical protein
VAVVSEPVIHDPRINPPRGRAAVDTVHRGTRTGGALSGSQLDERSTVVEEIADRHYGAGGSRLLAGRIAALFVVEMDGPEDADPRRAGATGRGRLTAVASNDVRTSRRTSTLASGALAGENGVVHDVSRLGPRPRVDPSVGRHLEYPSPAWVSRIALERPI